VSMVGSLYREASLRVPQGLVLCPIRFTLCIPPLSEDISQSRYIQALSEDISQSRCDHHTFADDVSK